MKATTRTVAIIQARTGSSRLPGKVLMKLGNKTILERVIERVEKTKRIDKVIVATTTEKRDDAVRGIASMLDVRCFRGSEKNVLQRFCGAAKTMNLTDKDLIVRITADCPFIDPKITDETIAYHKEHGFDYTNNVVSSAYFPRGFDSEVFSYGILKKVEEHASTDYDKEHVTTYIRNNPGKFNIGFYRAKGIFRRPDIKVCVDTDEDLKRAQMIVNYLGEGKISAKNIIKLFKKPKIAVIGEASNAIGTAHVIRPLKILDYIKEMLDCDVVFFTDNTTLEQRISQSGCRISVYETARTKEERMRLIKHVISGFAATIVDMLEISPGDAKSLGGRIFCIEEGYPSPENALLSREFDSMKKKQIKREVEKILITFGGSDPHNMTLTALIPLLKMNCEINVVIGSMFKHKNEITKICKNYKNVRAFHDVKNMARLMSWADMAICSGGTTMYELCYLGVPSIVISNTKYENEGAEELRKRGATVNLGMHDHVSSNDIYKAAESLMNDHGKRKILSTNSASTVKNATPALAKEIVTSLIPP